VLKFSQAISRVNVELKTNVSKISSVFIDPDDADREDLSNVGFQFNTDTAHRLRF
jgi:hypothetical protein